MCERKRWDMISARTRRFSMAMCKFIYISYINRSFSNHIIVLCYCLQVILYDMTGQRCVVCGNTSKRDPNCSFHRFPSSLAKRTHWLQILEIDRALLSLTLVYVRGTFPLEMPQKIHSLTWVKDLLRPLKRICQEQREQRQQRVLRT